MKQMITPSKTPRAITVIGYCLLVIVLASCSGDGSQMRQQLEELERQNRADSVMTNDSLAEHLVKYFDRHGTPNERMRAHYILGRTYADMGEAPRAVDAYLDAASQADTTAADCDYRTLSAVYSQMADVLHRQLLLSDEIEARKHSYHFAVLNGKPIIALSEKKLSASAYILLNKRDSAEMLLKEVLRQYEELGYVQEGIQASTMLMHLYIEIPEKKYELEHLIDRYDKESNMFDENHELHSKMRLFYYYKGKYYEGINQLDSAEFYYRKVYHPEIASVAQNSMYKGLLNVFQKRHQADSIIKYAQLYCMVNDSSIALNDRQTTAQMAASYNYHLYQKEALKSATKANRLLMSVIALLIIGCIAIIAAIILRHKYLISRKEKNRLIHELAEAMEKFEQNRQQLQLQDDKHRKRIKAITDKLEANRQYSKDLKSQNEELKQSIQLLNDEHQENQQRLEQEAEGYRKKAEALERQLGISAVQKSSLAFFNMGIVNRVRIHAKDVNKKLSEEDLSELLKAAEEYFPDLTNDMKSASIASPLAKQVCILVILNLKPFDICHLLDISSSQVGNLKKHLNQMLFGEGTSRTLYKNLSLRYKFYSL